MLRTVPTQARSWARLERVLDAADELLAEAGAEGFTTTRVAARAGLPVGSVYRFFADKEALAESLAVRHWARFADLVAAAADLDARRPHEDPGTLVLQTLAAGFRGSPGFLALWYGGLLSERIRAATRPARVTIGASIERILTVHWPQADPERRAEAARIAVLAGDGLLREAFRRDPEGDEVILREGARMLGAYLRERLEER